MKRTTLLLVLAAPFLCSSCELPDWLRRDPDQCNVFFLPPLREHLNGPSMARSTALALNDRDQVVGYSEANGELVPVLWRFILDDDLERLRNLAPEIDEVLECDRDWPYAPLSYYGDEWSVCVSRLDSPWGVDATANAIANPVSDPNSTVLVLGQTAVGKIVGGVGEGLASQIVLWDQSGTSLVSDYLMARPNGVTSSGGIVGRRFEFRPPRLAAGGFVRWDGDSPFQATDAALYAITEGAQGPVASGAQGLTPVLLRPTIVRRTEQGIAERLGAFLTAETMSFALDPIQETLGGQGVAFDVEEGSKHGVRWTTAVGYAKDGDVSRPALWTKAYGPGTTVLPPAPDFLELGSADQTTPIEGRALAIRRVGNLLRVIGWYLTEGKQRAFTWDSKGGGIDLNKRKLRCTGFLTAAHDINRKGHIVGVADPDGAGLRQRGFLMVPDVDLTINPGDSFYIKKNVRVFQNPPPFEYTIPGYAAKGATVTYRFRVNNPHGYEVEATIVDTLSGAVDFIEVPSDQTAHNDPDDCKLVGSKWDPDERRVEIDLKIRHTCLIDMVVKVRIWGQPYAGTSDFWHNTVPNWDYWLTVKGVDFEHAPIDWNTMGGYFRLLEEPPPPPPPTASVVMYRTLLFETTPEDPAADTGDLVGFRFDVDLGDFDPSEVGSVEVWDRLPNGPDGAPGLALDHSAETFEPEYEGYSPPPPLPAGFCDPSGAGVWQDAGGGWVKAVAHIQGSEAHVCRLITKVIADPPPGEPWLLDNKEYKVIVDGTEFHNDRPGELVAVYEPE